MEKGKTPYTDSEAGRVGCREERGRDGRDRTPTSSLCSMDPYKEEISFYPVRCSTWEGTGGVREWPACFSAGRSSGTEGEFRSQGRTGGSALPVVLAVFLCDGTRISLSQFAALPPSQGWGARERVRGLSAAARLRSSFRGAPWRQEQGREEGARRLGLCLQETTRCVYCSLGLHA